MAQIVETRDLSLEELTIGKGQVRTQDVGAEIDELARSIKAQGLLQPIVVCEARTPGKFEILVGQRRYLAHKLLGRATITARILDTRVSEGEAKAISITENLIRRKLSGKELTDGLGFLYKIYGSIKDVAAATGLPVGKVSPHVRYPRLVQPLKDLVDSDEVAVQVALKAQDAVGGPDGTANVGAAVTLAKEMTRMSGVQRGVVVKKVKNAPQRSVDEAIEEAITGPIYQQVTVTLSEDTHRGLKHVAHDERISQDDAASLLIREALSERGILSDDV